MTSSAPESPTYLPRPSSPLTRQIAVPYEESFISTRVIYWDHSASPPLYKTAHSYESRNELTPADALIALTLAWETNSDLQLCVRKPRGFAFQIFFGTPSPLTPSIHDVGIDSEKALEYVACDYIRHRYTGDHLRMPERQLPSNWMRLYSRALERASQLHVEILAQILA